jgi:hypothetical protein
MNLKKLMQTALELIAKGDNPNYVNSYGNEQSNFPYNREEMMKVSKKALDVLNTDKRYVISYLTETLEISQSMLATLLDITETALIKNSEKTLNQIEDESLLHNQSLSSLYFFLKSSLMNNPEMKEEFLISLLHEPLDVLNQNTPLFYILEEPKNEILLDNLNAIVEEFLKNT